MKHNSLFLLFLFPAVCFAQPEIESWNYNSGGQTSSYWENTAQPGNPPSFTYVTTTDLADVLQVCYDTDSVWINANGVTFNMGQYLNPGTCEAQDYVFRIPRTPTIPATKSIAPKGGPIGVLINGIPVFGLGNSSSYDNSSGTNSMGMNGDGIWNVEVYYAEGFVLDTAFGAHPQQSGAYHSHATPWRLYEGYSSGVHSPIVGYAFDGHPIYGPYGYSDATDAGSGVSRMQSGYSLRNITTRQTLPDGTALTSGQYGPAVSATYPLGMYCEDYEWLASNGGDLDDYNGRFCVTPEYPSGTYAYFVTMDAAEVPEFPYYVGLHYYGAPDTGNYPTPGQNVSELEMPASGTSCMTASIGTAPADAFGIYPNPATDELTIARAEGWDTDYTYSITTMTGSIVSGGTATGSLTTIDVSSFVPGIYLVNISDGKQLSVQRIVVQ